MLQKKKSVWENLSLVKGLRTGLTQGKKSYAEISDMLLPFQQWPQSVTGETAVLSRDSKDYQSPGTDTSIGYRCHFSVQVLSSLLCNGSHTVD